MKGLVLLLKALFLVVSFFGLHFQGCLGKGDTFEFCSRILALQETSELGLETAPATFGASEADPIGCINRDESLGPKDGFQVSACQQSSVKLNGLKSVFTLKLELDDKKGSLRAFESNTKGKSVCFQHDVPMGESEFADDSPRCFDDKSGKLIMFVTKTCPEALEGCVNNWLLAAEGKCDGTDSPQKETEPEADPEPKSKPPSKSRKQGPKSPTPGEIPPHSPPDTTTSPDPTVALPPSTPPATLPGSQETGPGPSFTVPPPSAAPFIPSGLPEDTTLPPGGGGPILGPQLPEDIAPIGPGSIPTGPPEGIDPNAPQNLPVSLPGDPTIPPGGGTGRGQLPEDIAPGGSVPIGAEQTSIPPPGVASPIPGGGLEPELGAGTGPVPINDGSPGVPVSVQNPAGASSDEKVLAIDLCFRVYSTTHLVDRTTCTGFGSSLDDPIRCIEDGQAFNPDTGIAYTPCADLRARLGPGDTKTLFNITIGDRPGVISAKLNKSLDAPRPVCIFVEVEGDGEFPEEDEAGCMHPWEPVSMFIGKTCRTKKACSYHSLMVAGGGCLAPRILPEDELKDLPEREGDLVAGFGEIGSEERYESPDGLVSQWIRCEEQPPVDEDQEDQDQEDQAAEKGEAESKEEDKEEDEEDTSTSKTKIKSTVVSKPSPKPTAKTKPKPKPKVTSRTPPKPSSRRKTVKPESEDTDTEEAESPPEPVVTSTAPIITSRTNPPKGKAESDEEDD